MRFVTTDPRSGGLADNIGAIVTLISGGSMTTLVKVASGDTDWAAVTATILPSPMAPTKCPAVSSDPRSGGRAADIGDVVLYYTGGAGTYLIKYGVANTSWAPLPELGNHPTGSGTAGRSTRWVGTRVLGDGAFVDDGTNATIAGLLTVKPAASGAVAAAANTLATIENSGAAYVTFKSTAAKGFLMSNASANNDGALLYDDTATPRGWQFRTAGVTQGVFTSAGSFIVGATALTKSTLGLSASEFTRDADSGFAVSAYGAAVTPEIMVFRGRGTGALSSAVQSGDLLGQYAFTGLADATTHFSGVLLRGYATENWTTGPSRSGTRLEVWTTPNGGVLRSLAFTFDQDGKITLASKASATAAAGSMRYSGSFIQISNATTWERVAVQSASTFTAGSVIHANSTGQLAEDNANLFYDTTTKRFGIGTASPQGSLGINTGASPTTSQINVKANGLGSLSVLNFAANNVSVGFDIERASGNWVARDTTVAHVYKLSGKLSIYGSGGHSVGATVASITERLGVDLTTGAVNIPGALSVNGTVTIGDATTDTHAVNGNVSQVIASGNGYMINNTATGITGDVIHFYAPSTATYNATASNRSSYAFYLDNASSRSAGANSLINYGLFSDVRGGQINYAIYTARGDNVFNVTSGASTFFGNVSVNGNAALGDTVADVHTVKGATTIWGDATNERPLALANSTNARQYGFQYNGPFSGANSMVFRYITGGVNVWEANTSGNFFVINNATVSGALTVNGNTRLGDTAADTIGFYSTAGAAQQTVTGSRGGNAALADLLTKLANLGLIVDSTTA